MEVFGHDDVRLVEQFVRLVLGQPRPSLVVRIGKESPVVFQADDVCGRMLPHVVQGGELAVPRVKFVDVVSLVGHVDEEFFSTFVQFEEIVPPGSYYIYTHAGKLYEKGGAMPRPY